MALYPRHEVAYGVVEGNLQRWDLEFVYLPRWSAQHRIENKALGQLEKAGIEVTFVTLYHRGDEPEERL
jgi:hypothetical protein